MRAPGEGEVLLRRGSPLILIVASERDVASRNIARRLMEDHDFDRFEEPFRDRPVYGRSLEGREVRLILLREELIRAQYLDGLFSPELIIFVSRHESRSRIPTLSVHTPGNLGEARHGGIPRRVSVAAANAMRAALREMATQREERGLTDYQVSYECTHHGPSLDAPAMFVEVGSSLREWEDAEAAAAVAHAAVAAALNASDVPAALGVGGPHYNRKFTRISLENELAFGHIIPKYALRGLDLEVLRQCVERTVEPVGTAVLDWKGMSGDDRRRVVEALREASLEIRRASDFRRGP
jgi:D-aminoacyl-tRNA deacylase